MTDARSSPPASSPAPRFERPSFEQLYASARTWLRGFGPSGVDAEDLLHDVMLIAHRELDRFHPRPSGAGGHDDSAGALRAWIVGIAWRLLARRQRKVFRRAVVLRENRADIAHAAHGVPSAEHGVTAAEYVVAASDRRRILIAILATVPRCRAEVLVLHELAEMSAPEIAQTLGLNENTVKSRFSRGRQDISRAVRRLPPEARSALEEELTPSEGGISLFAWSADAEAVLAFHRTPEKPPSGARPASARARSTGHSPQVP
jgi:RNA polymerase sigma-70 factor (ECF subfamily)